MNLHLKLGIASLLWLSLTNFYAQQWIDASMLVNRELREFVIFKPSGNPPSGGYPLVFMLHGSNQSGPQFYNISGWKEVAEREKFIVVFPTALIYCTTEGVQTKWSHGNTYSVLCPGDTLRDDIPFFYKMIDTISSIVPINQKKIYATGFSSGGTMVPKLTIEMPGVFAAAGCGSGNLDERDTKPMKPKVPTWAIRGTHDHSFIDRTGRPCPFNDTALVVNSNNLSNHLTSMGLSWNFSKDSNAYSIHYNFTDPLPGESKTFFRWSIFYGLEHLYFNGSNYLNQLPNPPIEAELFWEFFKTVSLINSTENNERPSMVTIYPNPSSESINILYSEDPAGDAQMLNLYNMTGQLVFKKLIQPNELVVIHISSIGSGIFILQLASRKQKIVRKIIFN
ncbi:MAG: T9SS type A sorting domain-containing protein [Saprospiraceae bacterium]|nr:T9SS type A sorting domain-containing protein [Candidatus Vicinibacter affinis]MBK9639785.1 T9SS type A sorting domain-containing protein [Candidatus Vicinibacter affinis]MBP6522909.1 T9SS type A sorting domain-containing protein [Saprospiraceae bacterium]